MPPRRGRPKRVDPADVDTHDPDDIISEMEAIAEAQAEEQAEAPAPEPEPEPERDEPDSFEVVVGQLNYTLADLPGLLERAEAAEHQVSLWKKRTENARRQADLWRKVANAIKGEKGIEIDRDLQI